MKNAYLSAGFKKLPLEGGREGGRSALPFFSPTSAGSQLQETFSPPPSFGPFRIFKDARKDKGQDDFLGNVVLRLKVSAAVRPLLQVTPQVPVKPHGILAASQPHGSTEITQDPGSEPQIDARSLSLVAGAPAAPTHSLSVSTSFIFNPIQHLPSPLTQWDLVPEWDPFPRKAAWGFTLVSVHAGPALLG